MFLYVEQLYSLPWYDLYERDEKTNQIYLDTVTSVAKNPELGTVPTPVARHDVLEKSKFKQRRTSILPRFISPLFDTAGKVSGVLNTFQILSSCILPPEKNLPERENSPVSRIRKDFLNQ